MKHLERQRIALLLLTPILAFTAPRLANAQSTTLDAFSPAQTWRDGFAISTAEDQGHMRFGAQLYLDYANDPLVYESDAGEAGSESRQIVANHLVGHLGLTLGLADRLVIFAGLNASLVMSGDSTEGLGVPEADGAHIGDAYLGARARILGTTDSVFMLAAQATVTFPIADLATPRQAYAGDETVTFHPQIIAQINVGRLRLVANLGFKIRQNQTFLNVEVGDQVTYGLGGLIRIVDGLDAIVEIHGASTTQQFFHRDETPLELLLGAKYRHSSGFFAGVAAGPGLVRGFGSPDVRALLTVGYTQPERAPVLDTDGDGIKDDVDACPTEPEDIDSFEDENGCPDPDNDGDGVLDGVDRCPTVPGVPSEQGCPIPDRDQDTVPDATDNCPDEPGTVANHGCREQQLVQIEGDQISVVENVYFRSNRDVIETRSYALLDNVARVIAAHPEITRVSVEGHTDSRGNRARNVRLSEARARAVVRYLIQHGVPADKLAAAGFGPDRPVVTPERTPEDHARNRRVEFHIEGANVPNAGNAPDGTTVSP